MNEMGLDPGIDHMLAMECINKAKAESCTVSEHCNTEIENLAPVCVPYKQCSNSHTMAQHGKFYVQHMLSFTQVPVQADRHRLMWSF